MPSSESHSAARRIWSHVVVKITAPADVPASLVKARAYGHTPMSGPVEGKAAAGSGLRRIGRTPWAAIHSAGTKGEL